MTTEGLKKLFNGIILSNINELHYKSQFGVDFDYEDIKKMDDLLNKKCKIFYIFLKFEFTNFLSIQRFI
jgi:hypothetical protein